MRFQINDRVVHPSVGIGRIVSVTAKPFAQADGQTYYEVSGERATAWIPVEGRAGHDLRALTSRDKLSQLRSVLRGRPLAMNLDFRQRQLEVRSQLKRGTLQCVCEVVRDLHGRSWSRNLNEFDLNTLRQASDALCEEWAAAEDVSLAQARAEVSHLLQEGRQAFAPAAHGAPPAKPA